MKLESVEIEKPNDVEMILGQGTFNILAVEQLYSAIAVSAPTAHFGIAFNEGSDAALLRKAGNNPELVEMSVKIMYKLGCGHCFVVLLRGAYPVQVLNEVKKLPTIIDIKAATGNPAVAIVARTGNGSALLGVADGKDPASVETSKQSEDRAQLVRKLGYLM